MTPRVAGVAVPPPAVGVAVPPAVGVMPFVRLKVRLTANGLRGRPGRIALFAVGVLMAGLLAVGGYSIFAIPGLLGSERAAGIVLPLGGTGIALGWLLLPLIFFGVDESLDPARFALLPLPHRTLIAGQFAAVLAGIPALSTLAATAGMVVTAGRLGGPAAAAIQLAGILAGLFLCVALCRAVTSAFATALRSRRARDLAAIMLALIAATLGPLQMAVLAAAPHANWDTVAAVARVAGWTPLGAPYSIGLDAAAGRWWAVPVRLLIVVAAGAVLLRWWGSTLEHAMLGARAAGGRRASAAGNPVDLLMFGRLPLVGRLPRNRFGALAAREVRYWWRETRRRAALITFSVVGVFLPISASLTGGPVGGMLLFVGALAAMALANQFGYDASAYAANITASVPGRIEVQSRATAHAIYTLPLLVTIAAAVGVASGHPARIAADLGVLIAAYGVGLGLVLPISVRAAFALPDTANPFAVSSGGGLAKGLLTMAVLLGAVLAGLPLQVVALVLGPAHAGGPGRDHPEPLSSRLPRPDPYGMRFHGLGFQDRRGDDVGVERPEWRA